MALALCRPGGLSTAAFLVPAFRTHREPRQDVVTRGQGVALRVMRSRGRPRLDLRGRYPFTCPGHEFHSLRSLCGTHPPSRPAWPTQPGGRAGREGGGTRPGSEPRLPPARVATGLGFLSAKQGESQLLPPRLGVVSDELTHAGRSAGRTPRSSQLHPIFELTWDTAQC